MSARVSVLTPAYQRAGTLPRLFASLEEQSFADFEWVVVDDGSDDGTRELVAGWSRSADFPIRYHWQQNAGKHAAVNRGVELAAGEFCALIDSDDWYMPGALAGMVATWESIPEASRDGFANVEGQRVDQDGNPVGDRFPSDVFDSNTFELEALHGIHGDTIGMYRTDVLRQFPFPEDLGWHITPSLVWNRIAARFQTRFTNQVWGYTDYQDSGLSARDTELRLRFPRAQLAYWSEIAAMPRPMTLETRYRANANRCRYLLLCGEGPGSLLRGSPTPAWALAAAPAGALLHLRDRRALRRLGPGEEGA